MEIKTFLKKFFELHGCEVSVDVDDLKIELTEEMDKAIMNRPFYWHYMKQTNQKGVPLTLHLTTNVEKQKDNKQEFVHTGSPRLQQIYQLLYENYKFTRLYEQFHTETETALYPWIVLNLKVVYKSFFQKSHIYSIGLNLVNGQMIVNMMDRLEKLQLNKKIPHFCYCITPLIKIKSGLKRIENTIVQFLENQNHAWAEQSIKKMNNELNELNDFSKQLNEKDSNFLQQEKNKIKERLQPKIKIKYINGGLIYTRRSRFDV